MNRFRQHPSSGRFSIKPFLLILLLFFRGSGFAEPIQQTGDADGSKLRFELQFPRSAHDKTVKGRIYVIISRTNNREPRLQIGRTGTPFWGLDVDNMKPGQRVILADNGFGSPIHALKDLPPGDYFVQGLVNIYSEFKRADGHTVWMHDDRWEGQRFNRSPGNLYSDVIEVHLDPSEELKVSLNCEHVIPPLEIPPDTKWVRRFKIQSALLSEFWGRPIYLGATVLLPKGYDENPGVYYPVDYIQGHFSLRAPYGFRTEDPGDENPRARRGFDLYSAWVKEHFPRMILVTFQHPCPYFDDSYAVNSVNCGPYGDALMTELIPEIERRFRIIREPYARILEGGSTGGWEALALQIFQPDFFGGCFAYCPDPVDFRDVEGINIYEDRNAYEKHYEWRREPTISVRRADGIIIQTCREKNYYELARGTKGRSGEQFDIWSAVYGPVGEDGYFKPLYDKVTGEIDPEVAAYWKENYDLRHYLEKNWSWIGPKLVGKLHLFTGDMDTFYLNNAVLMLQDFMNQTEDPHYPGFFWYAPRKPHCWAGPFTPEQRLVFFATHIATHTPRDVEVNWWNY